MDPQPAKPLNEQYLARVKNRRWVALLLVAGTIVIGLASFTDAAKKLVALVSRPDPIVARQELAKISMPYSPDAFFAAIRNGDVTAVKLYLAAGMSPNTEYEIPRGWTTPLFEAARTGRTTVLTVLLDANADPMKRNAWGSSPLATAAREGHIDVVRVLLARQADAAAVTQALMWVASDGGAPVAHVLLQAGADPNARDKDGRSAFDRAKERDHKEMIRIFTEHGAR